jgi:hypothetical protein
MQCFRLYTRIQYSLMQPPTDSWLKARTLVAQRHGVQPATIPNNNNNDNNNSNNHNNNNFVF